MNSSMIDVATYICQLSLAHVEVIDDEQHEITFNGASSVSEFESRLLKAETCCLELFWKLWQKMEVSFTLKKFVKQNVIRLEELFIETEQGDTLRTDMHVYKAKEQVLLCDLMPETRVLISECVNAQLNSLARSRCSRKGS